MRPMLSALCALALVGGCRHADRHATSTPEPIQPGTYRVHTVHNANIRIDGQLDEPAWQLTEPLDQFTDPWRPGAPATHFKALIDGEYLYFAFEADDSTPRRGLDWRGEKTLDEEDRVEIYFAHDPELKRYYCIEIDPDGRVHDFLGSFPRQWDSDWTMPGLKTAGRSTPTGYVVEGMIPLARLAELGVPPLKPGQSWRVGLFRADLGQGNDVYWISWIDPQMPQPNFHVPSAFGTFHPGQVKRVR